MKHSIEELYTIKGQRGIYSEDYLYDNFILTAENCLVQREGEACRLMYRTNAGTLNVRTANGIKVVYTIGEKTWYDTQVERDEARKMNAKKHEENARRRAAMEKLDKLSTAQLEKLVMKLGL